MTAEDPAGGPERTAGATHGTAGPYQGPAHSGDRTSAEPGGFDEFDHPVGAGQSAAGGSPAPTAPGDPVISDGTAAEGDSVELPPDGELHPDTVLAAERLLDLQRLQAEYVNYKRRVDRDREVARDAGTVAVLEALLPVLDDIHLAREHGDLVDGPLSAIADKLAAALTRFGVTSIGAAGEEFDPSVHEALMHVEAQLPDHATTTTVVQVLQPGYKVGERVVRPARVSVADPQ